MGTRSASAEALLAVRDLCFTYRDATQPALANISLELPPGDLLVVMGASGAGKSTFCRCLNGIIPHFLQGSFEGEVKVVGESTRERSVAECARQVGLVFQDFESQLFATNVELEVAFGPQSLGVPRAEIARRVEEMLALVGLSQLRSRQPASLSGGEKQRLAIAAALAMQPALLVLDEATSDLDPAGKSAVFGLAKRLAEPGSEKAVVLAHHDAEEAMEASLILLLSEGSQAALGPPEEVLSRPRLLSENGVVPLAGTALFEELGLEERPLREEEAAELLLARGLRVGEDAAGCWEARDSERAAAYGEPIIEARSLTHRYGGGEAAVRGASLTVRRREYLAIIGQNGSGKTTLVKHLNGLLRPTEGEVFVESESARELSLRALAQQVGYVFQNPDHQIFAGAIFEEVAFAPRNFGLEEQEVSRRVRESLSAVGLSGREDEDPFGLTKGERQRVAVASVLAGRPEVLIFDEPTTGLDQRESQSIMAMIDELNRRGHTIILVTHAMWVVAEHAHRVIVMQDGEILLDAPTRAAFSRRDVLEAAAIIPPQVVRLSRRLGGTALRVAELVEALRRG